MFQIEESGLFDHGPCECCGSMSRLATGLVYRDGNAYAVYQVHWTVGQIERHGASFYIFLGQWGEDATATDRFAVAIRYRADAEATGFMIVDADQTCIASDSLAGRALRREEVVNTPLAKKVFDLIDFIWLHDGRISEVTEARTA
jgi:hypothetical protein